AWVADHDYVAQTGTVTFEPGKDTQTITILVVGDVRPEANETFFVNLSNATGALLLDAQGVGTITNDDHAPALSVPGDQTAFEDVDLSIEGIRVGGLDGDNLSVTLGVSHGTLTLALAPGQTVSGSTLTISGTSDYLNGVLDGLVYRGALD